MIIYKITNKVNGKIYIGQTIRSLEERWNEHIHASKKRSRQYIGNAIKKYSPDNFIVEEIDRAKNIDELNGKEMYWIQKENSICPNGYNLMTGGKNSIPCKETRNKISKASKKMWESEEYQNKMSEIRKKIWGTEEYQNKMSEIRKIGDSEETRNKISKAHKGKTVSEETRKKMSEARKTWDSEETRKKMSEAIKKVWESEEYRKKISEAKKGKIRSNETRKKISEARKRYFAEKKRTQE